MSEDAREALPPVAEQPETLLSAYVAAMEALARTTDSLDAARHAYIALGAAEPIIRADERKRIRIKAEPMKATLVRPGYGHGPEHGVTVAVVAWEDLAKVLEDSP